MTIIHGIFFYYVNFRLEKLMFRKIAFIQLFTIRANLILKSSKRFFSVEL